jgi:RimJ/RimL family protein N-acetyltransferase
MSERDTHFVIYEKATLRPIGSTGLHQIDHGDRTAEFGIMIGEKECWGKGYGTETTRLVLEYGFVALGLHNIMLRVYAYNDRGIRAYRRAGFREFGRRRQAQRFGDQAYDVIYMECLSTEFQGSVLSKLLPAT